ncbi:hypothetical protein SAMN05428939_7383 [Streptomyces sp. TLI_105]|nr:hypothetical protein SAMN05428939_7383 [Streptomyces sp. TLI_105]
MEAPVHGPLDIGGTEIAGGPVEHRRLSARAQCATPAHGSAEEMTAVVTTLLDDLAGRPELTSLIGVDLGGASPVDIVSQALSTCICTASAWRSRHVPTTS